MALNKVGEAALAVKDDLVKSAKPKKEAPDKKVLDEDTYTEVNINNPNAYLPASPTN